MHSAPPSNQPNPTQPNVNNICTGFLNSFCQPQDITVDINVSFVMYRQNEVNAQTRFKTSLLLLHSQTQLVNTEHCEGKMGKSQSCLLVYY